MTCGTPSIAFGRRCPWKWIPVDSAMRFVKIARTLSPSVTSMRGPGQVPLNPSPSSAVGLRVDLVLDGIDGQLEDLGVAVHRRRKGLVALARQGRALAAQEPVDRRLRVGVMVDDRC